MTGAGSGPKIDPEAWIAPGAHVLGDVHVGPRSSIWFGTVVRGDVHAVRIGAGTNLQDLCVVHVTRDRFPAVVGDDVTVGHHATIHGCTVRDGALVGIGAIVLDGADVGEGALVAAGALVPPGMKVPDGALVMGSPARVVRTLSEAERELQREQARHYAELAARYARGGAP
ncbi:serine O-acetyltransferase [Myxococcaceae bacterium]|jgi:carbonic anhydrase/acetyltransferase-like protein (isoleucine patch superfamily)|nr:serine O-acetyltransferase [Myxococcaceae bacterium]